MTDDQWAIVCVGDTHIGGTTALMPPSFTTEDGIKIKPSKAQAWLWECWLDFTATVKNLSRSGQIFVIHGGDIIEGNHHQTMQILTADDTSHTDLAIEVLEPLMQHASGCAFVRGTPAHAGQMSRYERGVASHFRNRGLVMGEYGVMHPVFKRTIFGKRINVAHHVRGGATHRLRLAALLTMVERHTMSALWRKSPLPDYAIRHHTHHYADTECTYSTRAFTVPCWQFPTEHIHKIAPDELPHIGGVIITARGVEAVRYPILKEDRNYPAVKLGKK